MNDNAYDNGFAGIGNDSREMKKEDFEETKKLILLQNELDEIEQQKEAHLFSLEYWKYEERQKIINDEIIKGNSRISDIVESIERNNKRVLHDLQKLEKDKNVCMSRCRELRRKNLKNSMAIAQKKEKIQTEYKLNKMLSVVEGEVKVLTEECRSQESQYEEDKKINAMYKKNIKDIVQILRTRYSDENSPSLLADIMQLVNGNHKLNCNDREMPVTAFPRATTHNDDTKKEVFDEVLFGPASPNRRRGRRRGAENESKPPSNNLDEIPESVEESPKRTSQKSAGASEETKKDWLDDSKLCDKLKEVETSETEIEDYDSASGSHSTNGFTGEEFMPAGEHRQATSIILEEESEQNLNNEKAVKDFQVVRDTLGEPDESTYDIFYWFLNIRMIDFIQKSPLVFISTIDEDGFPSISPKGDEPGFVRVVDNTTLQIPERKGNKLGFTLHNIIQTPKNAKVGLLFVIPGRIEVLRMQAENAMVLNDPELNDALASKETQQPALFVTELKITKAYFNNGRAFLRSQMWGCGGGEEHVGDPSETPAP